MKYISPLSHLKTKEIQIGVSTLPKIGDTIIYVNDSIEDTLLFSHQRIEIIASENVKLMGTYIKSFNGIIQANKIILDKPLISAFPANAIYYATFEVESDNELMTESDALKRLQPIESIYPKSTLIAKPTNYSDSGKSGLIDGESYNKLNRLQKFIEFENLSFVGTTPVTIAIIRCDNDYNLQTKIEINNSNSFNLSFNFSVSGVSFDSEETTQYLEVTHFEGDVMPTLSFKRETGLIKTETVYYLRVILSLSKSVVKCKMNVSVDKFENLLVEQAITLSSIKSKFLKLNNIEAVQILNGIIGYSKTGIDTLSMPGESQIKPIEILNGDLNNYKLSGFYYATKINSGNILNKPYSVVGETTSDNISFRLNVISDSVGNTIQEYTYMELPQTEKEPRIFQRVFTGAVWCVWSEVGRKIHNHKLEDLTPTDKSLHFTKLLKDTITKNDDIITNLPLKITVKTIADLPEISTAFVGAVVSVQNPAGLYMCEMVGTTKKWVAKTIEYLKIFDIAVAQTVAGLISPKLYDKWNLSGMTKEIKKDSKIAYVNKHNDEKLYSTVNEYYDLVSRTDITPISLGSKSISFGFGDNQLSTGVSSIAIGTSNYVNGLSSIAIGTSNYASNNYEVTIGTGLVSNSNVVLGKNNTENNEAGFIIGDGDSDTNKHNLFEVLKNGTTKSETFAKVTPKKGKEIAYAMLEDGTGYNIDLLTKQSDFDKLKEEVVTRGSNFKITFEGVDGSINETFMLIDNTIMFVNVPNGKLSTNEKGTGVTPEGFQLKPEYSPESAVIIPGIYSKSGQETIVLAEYVEGEEEPKPIDLTDSLNLTKLIADFPTYLKIVDYSYPDFTLTYSNSEKIIYIKFND